MRCSIFEPYPEKVLPYLAVTRNQQWDRTSYIPWAESEATGSYRLGAHPVRIFPPIIYSVLSLDGPARVEQGSLELDNSTVFTQGGLQLYTWPWLQYWDRQIRYWYQRQSEKPEYIQITLSQGIVVNRWVYQHLAEMDMTMWEYMEECRFMGGYENPDTMGQVEWEYPKRSPPSYGSWKGF